MNAGGQGIGDMKALMEKMGAVGSPSTKPPEMTPREQAGIGGNKPPQNQQQSKPSGNASNGGKPSPMTSGSASSKVNGPDWKVAGERVLTVVKWVGRACLFALSIPLIVIRSVTEKPWCFLLLGILGGLGCAYGFGINVEGYWDQFTDSASPFMLKPGIDDGARFENFFASLGSWEMSFAIGLSLLIQGVQSYKLAGLLDSSADKNTAKKLGLLFWFFFAIDAAVAFANYPVWGVSVDSFFLNLIWFIVALIGCDFMGAFALHNMKQFGKGFSSVFGGK